MARRTLLSYGILISDESLKIWFPISFSSKQFQLDPIWLLGMLLTPHNEQDGVTLCCLISWMESEFVMKARQK